MKPRGYAGRIGAGGPGRISSRTSSSSPGARYLSLTGSPSPSSSAEVRAMTGRDAGIRQPPPGRLRPAQATRQQLQPSNPDGTAATMRRGRCAGRSPRHHYPRQVIAPRCCIVTPRRGRRPSNWTIIDRAPTKPCASTWNPAQPPRHRNKSNRAIDNDLSIAALQPSQRWRGCAPPNRTARNGEARRRTGPVALVQARRCCRPSSRSVCGPAACTRQYVSRRPPPPAGDRPVGTERHVLSASVIALRGMTDRDLST